jgi:hypothetical protein
MTEERNAVVCPIDDKLAMMLRGAPPAAHERLMTVAIRSHKEELMSYPREVSWFSSKAFGGLGLPWTRPGTISERHRRVAAFISCLDAEKRFDVVSGISRSITPKEAFREQAQRSEISIMRKLRCPIVQSEYKPAYLSDGLTLSPWCFVQLGIGLTDTQERVALGHSRWTNLMRRLFKKSFASGDILTPMSEEKAATTRPVAFQFDTTHVHGLKSPLPNIEQIGRVTLPEDLSRADESQTVVPAEFLSMWLSMPYGRQRQRT